MAESTLTLSYNDIAAEVGFFLGHGRGATAPYADPAWSTQQQAAIDSCIRSGLRKFYFPPPLDGESSSYSWSFLKPMATLAVASGATTVACPDDFGGVEGQMMLSSTTGLYWFPIDFVGLGRVQTLAVQYPTTTGRPQMAAQEPLKGTTGTQGQRFQFRLWPVSDQAYTLKVQYYINPDYLNAGMPYAYGGMPHAETILEACLAVAEQRLDDAMTVHSELFMQRLAASVNNDRRMKPQMLGYNRDNSDLREKRFSNDPWSRFGGDAAAITYRGQSL